MCMCVLSSADPEARTLLDQQTPLHYAAKNDAVGSIKLLLQAGASISCTDYKHRTPLQLAANLGTTDTILTSHWHDVLAYIITDSPNCHCHSWVSTDSSGSLSTVCVLSERQEAAQVLLELGAKAGMKDADGQLCITALIDRISSVVKRSLLLTDSRVVIVQ